MSSTTSPLLALPFIQPSQAQKHVTHNEALRILDAVAQLGVRSFGAVAPPADPAAGDVFALGAGAQGDWAGQDGRLALWDGAGWLFIEPRTGWRAWGAAERELRVHEDGAWRAATPPLVEVEGLGINAGYDATNRLAVSAPATLLSHDGAGHRLKVNKAAAADTASLLFQSGWTGRAEIGLAGDLDFSLKVSGGSAWTDALTVARATGRVTLPQGATVGGTLTGTAVQSSPLDATPGRLLAVGAFGLGGLLPAIGSASVTDASIAPGHYAYDIAAGSSGGPTNVSRGSLLHARRATGGGETQFLVVEAASGSGAYPGMTFSRSRAAGGWTNWFCGSVQQSAATANGRFVRHQDGTQTCWHSLATSDGAETVWTFPASFSSLSHLVITTGVVSPAVSLLAPRIAAKSTTQASVSVIDAANARVAATLDVCATGRWH